MIREELEACALLPWANPVTNESLKAIMAGIAPNKRDIILAIGLDQSLALIERAYAVQSIDSELSQIEYGLYIKRLIMEGRFNEFFAEELREPMVRGVYKQEFAGRCEYFSHPGRMDRIRRNIPRLTFVHSDITDARASNNPNKAYISNVVGCFGNEYEFVVKLLLSLVQLPHGGSFYVANGNYVDTHMKRAFAQGAIPRVFTKDRELTKLASGIQRAKAIGEYGWDPRVYRRR
ncbi:hypothetical protein J4464_06265 [Candidatus Woesearchaeota archaeon]|nr:hypothetical protein [Candidatus Woesearchaeota archaeon]